jgi:hypothetical protein
MIVVKDWLSTDWLLLRPLLVVAITWAALIVALVAAWIRKLIAARSGRVSVNSDARHLVPAGTQVAPPEFASGSPPPRSATDRESRAA